MDQKLSKCRLCLEENKLCKSHIYPEFMYKNCYDDNHRFIEFSANEHSFNKKRLKGFYEELLCIECEKNFQQYEDYAKSVLYDDIKPMIKLKRTPYSTTGYNYTKFKLFILSLLWRTSISSLNFFRLASLGKYEDKLRVILFRGLKTNIDNFPCVLYQTHIDHKLADGVFMQIYPGKAKADGRTIYQFIVDGLYVFIGVGICSKMSFPDGSSISPENLRVGYDEIRKVDHFLEIYNRLFLQGKFSEFEKRYLIPKKCN